MTVYLGGPRHHKTRQRKSAGQRARKGDTWPVIRTVRIRLGRGVFDFARDRSGGVAIYAALTITALLGFVGMSIDIGTWYASQRNMQSAADAAAIGAALAVARGENPVTLGRQTAVPYGYVASEVTINNPPSIGPNSTNALYVEAIIVKPSRGFTSGLFRSTPVTIASRAVAKAVYAAGCVYALNPTAAGALTVSGVTTVNLGCGAQVNSDDPNAIIQNGAGCLNADVVSTAGGIKSGSCVNATTTTTSAPVGPDPFSYLTPPSILGCDEPAGFPHVVSTTVTLNPGRYCGGLKITGGTVTFAPGEYVFDEIGLHITGSATVNGTDVTFYFQDSVYGISGALVNVAGATDVNLAAPAADPFKGILMYGDPGIDPILLVKIKGGTDMSLQGVIYFPSSPVEFGGNSTTFGTPWTVVIGDTVKFSGNTALATGDATSVTGMSAALLSGSLAE